MSGIQQLQNAVAEWSDTTFGCDRRPEMLFPHLVKEIQELIDSPYDRMEYADCFMLLLDAYRMSGNSGDDLVHACFEKLNINKCRQWGPPNEDGTIEHIRK